MIGKSTEHYYQAGKFDDPWNAYQNGINGKEALKDIGSGQLQKLMKNYPGQKSKEIWQAENMQRMLRALWAKFTQHDNLQKLLLDTREEIIVEDAGSKDSFFGAGDDYNGENHLGQMLMQIRDLMFYFKEDNQKIPSSIPEEYVYRPYTAKEYIDVYKNKKVDRFAKSLYATA